jgi:DNA-binding beta-propeller fold protein YncE
MPPIEGEMCEWMPASASGSLFASLQQESGSASGDTATRPPLRVIRDHSPAYSAVAVDPLRDEVVLTDENLFSIMVYDRTTNTPPSAAMSEPKRMIRGLSTHIEFNCGLYIDPESGDVYSVNNDTINKLTIFSREARGDTPPKRELDTPHGTFGIAVDEAAQEMFLTIQHDSAIVIYPKMAQNEDSPIRLVQGDQTRLADPHGIALDTTNQLMFVTNHGSTQSHTPGPNGGPRAGGTLGGGEGRAVWPLGWDDVIPGSGRFLPPSITVHPLKASGNVSPVRVITGPKTQLNWPTGISFDSERNEIFIANDAGDSVLVFDAEANGDVAPVRVLKGPKSLIKSPTGVFVDVKNNELWVANFGNHSATVYPRNANGDPAPLRVIRSAPAGKQALMIGNPGAISYDTKREEILAPN